MTRPSDAVDFDAIWRSVGAIWDTSEAEAIIRAAMDGTNAAGHVQPSCIDGHVPGQDCTCPCDHLSWTGVDQMALNDPEKVWRCDGCGVTRVGIDQTRDDAR